jgi:hypothetical protein
MKFNKWTVGLAAVGAVSMASAVRADEAKMSVVNTALSSTTLSGYVDVGLTYATGDQTANSSGVAGTAGVIDRFSLNDVDITLDKPLDATAWSAGYHVELNTGQQAVGWGGANSAAAIRQGYITLNTPLGNGLTWKAGIQDDVIGYEGNTDGANPNYTRSYGYFVEPTTLLGLLGTYQFCSAVSATVGVANVIPTSHFFSAASDFAYVGSLSLTAPDSWGFLKGGTASFGMVGNFDNGGVVNYYAGVTIPTPLNALKVGAAVDFVSLANKHHSGGLNGDSGQVFGVYTTFAATDKLSFNARAEYFNLANLATFYGVTPYAGNADSGFEVTTTVAYNLWANVTSRAEFRWDRSEHGQPFGTNNTSYQNSFLISMNLIYTF